MDAAVTGPIVRGTPAFRRTNMAMFAAGFVTFAQLYCVQPLMPVFAAEFEVTPAESSLAVSFTTAALAFTLVLAGSLSERYGRKQVMLLSLLASSLLTLAAAAVASFDQLLVLRLVIGVALSGVPSVAMAYLGEEIAGGSVGLAIGLFIGGSAFGGMAGRLVCALFSDFTNWRLGLAAIGSTGLISAAIFWRALPESRHFTAGTLRWGQQAMAVGRHLTERGLPFLFLTGFLQMGTFVTIYNYVGFRLLAPPFLLSQSLVGALFSVYLIGMVASAVTGSLADRFGRRKLLWITILVSLAGVELTRLDHIAAIVSGVAIVTIGFFGSHALCSSWVTRRAQFARAQASSLYLFFYYMGSSVVGSLGGIVYARAGWNGVALGLIVLQLIALAIAVRLSVLAPLGPKLGENG
jgi:MFS transporter, YNFM family, putative membrane transport protein